MEYPALGIDETVAVIGFYGLFDVYETKSVVVFVGLRRNEAFFIRQLADIRIRRVDYECVVIFDDLENESFFLTLLNGFDGIIQNEYVSWNQ